MPVGLQLMGNYFSEAALSASRTAISRRPIAPAGTKKRRYEVDVVTCSAPFSRRSADETSENQGAGRQIGSRSALMVLHARSAPTAAGSSAGIRASSPCAPFFVRVKEAPSSVTTLKEGNTAILYGRPAPASGAAPARRRVQGHAPRAGGQERERFDFSEEFAPLDGYSASVRCDAGDDRYASSLSYSMEEGKLKGFEWRARVAPKRPQLHARRILSRNRSSGLQLASGACSVTLREVGEFFASPRETVWPQCSSQAYLEPLLVDRRGRCQLLHQERNDRLGNRSWDRDAMPAHDERARCSQALRPLSARRRTPRPPR